jgi:hypothetical protein
MALEQQGHTFNMQKWSPAVLELHFATQPSLLFLVWLNQRPSARESFTGQARLALL